MCYNCGCGLPNDDMGNPDNITTETISKAAKASSQTEEAAKKNMLELLSKEVKED